MAVKAKKQAEKEHHATDLLESSEALAEQLTKTEAYLEQNKSIVFIIIGVFVLVIGGFFGYRYYAMNQSKIAQGEMFQAIYYFEADSLNLALNGDGNNYGFLDIIDNYGVSDAANLAHFYAGAAYLKQGQYVEAIDYLEGFSASDYLVQARAYSLIGDAHMELGDFSAAAQCL